MTLHNFLDERFYWITSKYDSHCYECEDKIDEGDRILFDSKEHKVYCEPCGKEMQ